jgi:hypothetical protein
MSSPLLNAQISRANMKSEAALIGVGWIRMLGSIATSDVQLATECYLYR